jgi:hypothetical protein
MLQWQSSPACEHPGGHPAVLSAALCIFFPKEATMDPAVGKITYVEINQTVLKEGSREREESTFTRRAGQETSERSDMYNPQGYEHQSRSVSSSTRERIVGGKYSWGTQQVSLTGGNAREETITSHGDTIRTDLRGDK